MSEIRLEEFKESIVVYFGTELPRINAYTLASTLMGLADAAKAAHANLNPGYEVEVLVEALGGGSFKAQIRTVFQKVGNLFSKEPVRTIVLGVLANFIYQHTLAPDDHVKVNVGTNEVIIEQGDTKIIVPREVHEASKAIGSDPKFQSGVQKAVAAVEADKSITSLGFATDMHRETPRVEIPRQRFDAFAKPSEHEPESREIYENTEIQILRAILKKSKRKWEFVWNGMTFPAPVLDEKFFEQFEKHEITIAPGDRLSVRLKIKQKKSDLADVYVNAGFEVLEVFHHIPQIKQEALKQIRTKSRKKHSKH